MSKETLQALEVELTQLKKNLETFKNQKSVASSLLKSGKKDVETFSKTYEHHRKNLLFMRGPAEEVNLDEFVKTKAMFEDAKESLVLSKQQVVQSQKAISKMAEVIQNLNVEIKAVQKALDSYGQVVQFPIKKMS